MVITLQLGLVLLSDGPGVDDGDIACQLTNSPCSPPPPGPFVPDVSPFPALSVSLSPWFLLIITYGYIY